MKTTECIEAWCGTRCGCYEQGKAQAIKEVLDIVKKELRCSQVLSKNHNVDTCILCNLRYNILQKIQALTPNKGEQK